MTTPRLDRRPLLVLAAALAALAAGVVAVTVALLLLRTVLG
jgi:hypothetical protein